MSWNVTGTGTKAALARHFSDYFDNLIASTEGDPHEAEYRAAKNSVLALIDSAPDGHLIRIESYGSASYGEHYPSFEAKIDIQLIAPTIKERAEKRD